VSTIGRYKKVQAETAKRQKGKKAIKHDRISSSSITVMLADSSRRLVVFAVTRDPLFHFIY